MPGKERAGERHTTSHDQRERGGKVSLGGSELPGGRMARQDLH